MFSLRSTLRRKLLTYFYVNRSARVYVRQLAAALGVDSTNLSRELAALEKQGFFESEMEGRQRYYRLNPRYPYRNALFTLLQGAVGLPSTLAAALQRVAGIERAYLVGSFAKGQADAASDIDLLLIGRPDSLDLADSISRLEKSVHREVNYTVLSQQELDTRLAVADPFVKDLWKGERVQLIPDEQDQVPARRRPAGKAVSR